MGCHSFSIIRLAGCAVIKFLPSINCSKFIDVRTHDKWLIGDEVSLPWGGQMGGRRYRSSIDAAALVINKVYKTWEAKQVAGALLMDVKGAFDHVS